MGKMCFTLCIRVWAGEWCGLSGQLSFVSKKTDHARRGLMTKNWISNWSRDLSSLSVVHMSWPRREITWPIWDPISSSGRILLVYFLPNERELTGKTFTTPLTRPNPNPYSVKFIFPWSSPLKSDHGMHLAVFFSTSGFTSYYNQSSQEKDNYCGHKSNCSSSSKTGQLIPVRPIWSAET